MGSKTVFIGFTQGGRKMDIIDLIDGLESNGFRFTSDIGFKRVNGVSLFISDSKVAFLINHENDMGVVRDFLQGFTTKFSYIVLLNDGDKLLWRSLTSGVFIDVEVEKAVKRLTDSEELIGNTEEVMAKFEDEFLIKTTKEKDVVLSNGQRWVYKGGSWQKAFSVEDSNDYLKSLLFLGPVGLHFLRYGRGVKSYGKALLNLFTIGIYGLTSLEGVITTLIGKSLLVNDIEEDSADPDSREKNWLMPEKSIENLKLIVLSIPYVVVLIFVIYTLGGWAYEGIINFIVNITQGLV